MQCFVRFRVKEMASRYEECYRYILSKHSLRAGMW